MRRRTFLQSVVASIAAALAPGAKLDAGELLEQPTPASSPIPTKGKATIGLFDVFTNTYRDLGDLVYIAARQEPPDVGFLHGDSRPVALGPPGRQYFEFVLALRERCPVQESLRRLMFDSKPALLCVTHVGESYYLSLDLQSYMVGSDGRAVIEVEGALIDEVISGQDDDV